MLHTFLDDDASKANASAEPKLKSYLRSSILLELAAARGTASGDADSDELPVEMIDTLLETATRRYLKENALVGSPSSCLPLVRELSRIGVDEIACLVDFGLHEPTALGGLGLILELAQMCRSYQN